MSMNVDRSSTNNGQKKASEKRLCLQQLCVSSEPNNILYIYLRKERTKASEGPIWSCKTGRKK